MQYGEEEPLPLWGLAPSPYAASSASSTATTTCCCRVLVRVAVDAAKREVVPIVEHADEEFLRLFKHPSVQAIRGLSFVSLLLGAATDVQALLRVLCPQAQQRQPHEGGAHAEATALLNLYDKGRHPISCRVTSRQVDRRPSPHQQPQQPQPQQQQAIRSHHRLLLITPACFLAHCKGRNGSAGSLLGRYHPALAFGSESDG